ncbi:MAG: molybdopterin converting factor [Pseudomonas sp.]
MKVSVRLFGALSEYADPPQVDLEIAGEACIADLRAGLRDYLLANSPDFKDGLLRVSAFADSRRVLRDGDPVPDDGLVAVLPPVSGG